MHSCVPFYEGKDREELCDAFKENIEKEIMGILPPESVPSQITRWNFEEVLDPEDVEDWSTDYFSEVRRLEKVTKDAVRCFYPRGNKNNRNRALLLVKGGNYLIETL